MSQLKYFAYEHLPPNLQALSVPFHDMARQLETVLPDGDAKRVALDQLLKAKDAAVRSYVVDRKET